MIIVCALAHILVQMYIGVLCVPHVYTPPQMKYPDKTDDIYYVKGSNITFQCNATGSSKLWYKWIQNGTEIQNVSSVSFHPNTGVLNIVNFSVSEEATYRCIVNSTFVGDTKSHYVLIMSPALHLWQIRLEVFGTFGSNITKNVSQHQYFKLPCAASNAVSVAPKITYRWYELSGRSVNLDEGRLYIDLQGDLHFSYVLKVDEVGFYCSMSTRLGLDLHRKYGANHILQVVDGGNMSRTATKPVHQYGRVKVEIAPPCTAILECVFSGYDPSMPAPNQAWLYDSKKPLPANRKYILSDDGRQLTIYNLQEADPRTYYCRAKNSAGETDHEINVTVTIRAQFFKEKPMDRTVCEGTDVRFKCDARSYFNEQPSLPPVWYINGMETNGTSKIEISENNTFLTVKKVKKDTHIMCFQCEVPSRVNTIWASACLYVIKPIRILSQPPKVQTIGHNNCINLTVFVEAEPDVNLTYKWMFNNRCMDVTDVPPGQVSCHGNYNTRCINTTGLLESQLRGLSGTYKITISNEFDTKVVETTVAPFGVKAAPPEKNSGVRINTLLMIAAPMCVLMFMNACYYYKLYKAPGRRNKTDILDMFMVKPDVYRHRTVVMESSSTSDNENSVPSNSMTRETSAYPASKMRACCSLSLSGIEDM